MTQQIFCLNCGSFKITILQMAVTKAVLKRRNVNHCLINVHVIYFKQSAKARMSATGMQGVSVTKWLEALTCNPEALGLSLLSDR